MQNASRILFYLAAFSMNNIYDQKQTPDSYCRVFACLFTTVFVHDIIYSITTGKV